MSLLIVVASFPAAWWLIGDVSERDPGSGLDYDFGRIAIDRDVERAVGLPATIVLAVAALELLRRLVDGSLCRRRLLGVGVLTVTNLCAAFAARVLTAGTIGANIGGGMVLLFGIPLLLAGYAWGTLLVVRAR